MEKLNYNANGCANLLAGYALAYIEDAAVAIAQPDHATERQHGALARLQNGINGWNRDPFVTAIAVTTGRLPRDVYQGLLGQARLKASKRKPVVNRPVWDYRGGKKAS